MKKIPVCFEEYVGIHQTIYWLDRLVAGQGLQNNKKLQETCNLLWKIFRAMEFDPDEDIGYFFPKNFENGM